MYRRRVFTTAFVVVLVDLITKTLTVAQLEGQSARPLLGSFLKLSFARNSGAAFSFGMNSTLVFTAFAVVVSLAIIWYSSKVIHPTWALAFGGLLGGACGNLIDRIFRSPGILRGHVVDFIQLPHYPLFNVADSAIVCCAILMGYLSIRAVPVSAIQSDADDVDGQS